MVTTRNTGFACTTHTGKVHPYLWSSDRPGVDTASTWVKVTLAMGHKLISTVVVEGRERRRVRS